MDNSSCDSLCGQFFSALDDHWQVSHGRFVKYLSHIYFSRKYPKKCTLALEILLCYKSLILQVSYATSLILQIFYSKTFLCYKPHTIRLIFYMFLMLQVSYCKSHILHISYATSLILQVSYSTRLLCYKPHTTSLLHYKLTSKSLYNDPVVS